MKAKPLIWIIVILVMLGLAVFFVGGNRNGADTPDDSNGVEDNQVRLISPEPGSAVSSPLTVRGEARGGWFFEANIPIEIQDEDGNVLAQAGAQAEGEWMTTDFVEFEGTLSFDAGDAESGFIVVRKDNPSGLPEHDDSRIFPVIFNEEVGQRTTVKAYFSKDTFGAEGMECDEVFPVERQTAETQAVARAALNELLDGTTEEEMADGYVTSIPGGVEIQSLRIEDGTAYADFSEELDRNVGGSCRVTAIRAQIEETLKQFSTVDSVVISVEGNIDEALQP